MTQVKLRYRFKELYDSLTVERQRELRGLIMAACNIGVRTFYRWLNMEVDDNGDIQGRALIVFCDYFDMLPNEMLFTPPVMRGIEEGRVSA